ncbi:MAG: GntR family transcriptional regulator [Bacteroidota bacterium]
MNKNNTLTLPDQVFSNYKDFNQSMWLKVKNRIQDFLNDGIWQVGEALPNEAELAKYFGISMGTLRRAIGELVQEGVLVRKQGRGTFVAEHSKEHFMYHFFRLALRGKEKKYPLVNNYYFQSRKANQQESDALDISLNSPVFAIQNLLFIEETPVTVDNIIISKELFPGMNKEIFLGRDSTIYNLYQNRFGIFIANANDRLSAVRCDNREIAAHLELELGTPVLKIVRVSYTYQSKPVELRTSWVNSNAAEYYSNIF